MYTVGQFFRCILLLFLPTLVDSRYRPPAPGPRRMDGRGRRARARELADGKDCKEHLS